MSDPIVSVIIPSYQRPQLVVRAVRSAFNQSLQNIEVVVVVDGPDDVTIQGLKQIKDSRLQVHVLGERSGVGEARNYGIKMAQGKWIALLDDDDEWLPRKLELQLETAQKSPYQYPIVSCKFLARKPVGDVIFPRRVPEKNEPLSEYLFCQKSLFGGEGLILPSTIFTAKDLCLKIPFRHKELAVEGSDWLLRAIEVDGAGVEFVLTAEPLVIWHAEENANTMSQTTDWQKSLTWAETNAHLFTSKAIASFILIRASLAAKREGAWNAFLPLIREAFRSGAPTFIGILANLSIWFVPERTRFKIAGLMKGRPHAQERSHV